MPMPALQLDDIETDLRAPGSDAVPFEPPEQASIAARDVRARILEADACPLGIACGHELEPEEVVECEIEQGAVHVDEHGVDLMPRQADVVRRHPQMILC